LKTVFYIVFLILLSEVTFGQKLPVINVNHFLIVLDSVDVAALKQTKFIRDTLTALDIRTTKADSSTTWTGIYFEGIDNYLEISDSLGSGLSIGLTSIALSVDKTGEIDILNSILSKDYKTVVGIREKSYNDRNVPWFKYLSINDSIFNNTSNIFFWVMEYKSDYFNYNNWKYKDDKLTRKIYLDQYRKERKNKLLTRFTGLTFKATDDERIKTIEFLLKCGFRKNKNKYYSPENFEICFENKKASDRLGISEIKFECSKPIKLNRTITKNFQIFITNNNGVILLK